MHLSDPAISNIANDDVIHVKRKWEGGENKERTKREREGGRDGKGWINILKPADLCRQLQGCILLLMLKPSVLVFGCH